MSRYSDTVSTRIRLRKRKDDTTLAAAKTVRGLRSKRRIKSLPGHQTNSQVHICGMQLIEDELVSSCKTVEEAFISINASFRA